MNESFIFESEDFSELDPNFKKKKKNFKIIDLEDPKCGKYLEAEYKNFDGEKARQWFIDNDRCGEIAIDPVKDKFAGYIVVNKKPGKTAGFKSIGPLKVAKEYRGYGLSEILLKDAIKKYGGTDLGVFADNKVAYNLYKKFGFKEYKREKDKKSGEDFLIMTNQPIKESFIFESKKYYRYTSDGIGIYEALKKSVGEEEWKDILKSGNLSWLPKPPKYSNNYYSYFTKQGKDEFEKRNLKFFKDKLPDIKLDTIEIEDPNIIYQDKYQIVISESLLQEHVSKKDENYRSKGAIDLSSLKAKKLTQEIIDEYKEDFKFLKHARIGNNIIGRVFFRRDKIMCAICVEKHKSDGKMWIQALEVANAYREYGLGKQLLDYAVKKLGAEYLSVSKKNEVAIEMYEKYGFRQYRETKDMYFYTLNDDEKDQRVEIKESNNGKCPKCGSNNIGTILCADPQYKCKDCNYTWEVPFPVNEATEKGTRIIYPIDKDKNYITSEFNVPSNDGKVFNLCCKVNGYNYNFRGRSEAIIFKGDKIFMQLKPNNEFKLPGGGWDNNENHGDAAKREAQEEARINIKNLVYFDSYFKLFDKPHDWVQEKIKKEDWWYGYYTDLFVGEYDSRYFGDIEDIDKDELEKKGRWIDIDKALQILDPPHIKAIEFYIDKSKIVQSGGTPVNERYESRRRNYYMNDLYSGRFADISIGGDLNKLKRCLSTGRDTDIIDKIKYARNEEELKKCKGYISNSISDLKSIKIDKKLERDKNYRSYEREPNPYNVGLANYSVEDVQRLIYFYQYVADQLDSKLSRFSESVETSRVLNDYALSEAVNTGDKLIFFNEDTNDTELRRILYAQRLKQRKDLLAIYDKVKADFPFIKYAFPDLKKYSSKNIFIDTHYYMDIFFRNNKWVLTKGFNLFSRFMSRVLNFKELKANGYEKQTIMIPIADWDTRHDGSVWNYKQSLNPISIIYKHLFDGNTKALIDLFGDKDILFVGPKSYFKMNFSQMDMKESKKIAMKFRKFTTNICKNIEPDPEDIDTTADNIDSKEVIKAKLVDKIEASKGVDLTKEVNKASNKDTTPTPFATIEKTKRGKTKEEPSEEESKGKSKLALNQPDTADEIRSKQNKNNLAKAINTAAEENNSEEDALSSLNNSEIKQMIIDLDSGDDDKINITAARAARITELDKKLLDSTINGKSIKDILEEKPKEIDSTDIKVDSPNQEEWKNLTFMNFDKKYDINKDVVACFRFFEKVSRPISITKIDVSDNSTSEDRLALYTVGMEDYTGKRFTVKLDIPIMEDNRFLLRGNSKSIQTQFFNMPIIKTDDDTCQIISNYMKIFVRRFGNGAGKSGQITARLIKALNKYTGQKIKITTGDNTKICFKYELPIDYIDLAGNYSTIETPDHIFYFSQDELREKYEVKDTVDGVPFAYDKKNKAIVYFNGTVCHSISEYILMNLANSDSNFLDLYNSSARPTSSMYSRCSIMNTQIPLAVICGYHEGLRKTMSKAGIRYKIVDKLTSEDRKAITYDWIKFEDGYVVYTNTPEASMFLNGIKICNTEDYKLAQMDDKNMYLEFLDDFGGRIKADGLDNFYDCLVDPMTEEILKIYNLPTDYITILLYANAMLTDNKFHKHTDSSVKRLRRYELVAAYVFKVLSDAYSKYSNDTKHGKTAEFFVKQSAVIDKLLESPISSDDSCINALRDVETTNTITAKGPSGMNSDRAYSLDKRTYDDSMLNVLGMSTGFSGNVGISRQTTLNANIEGERGFVKTIKGNTEKMNTANTLTATEAIIPFGSTHDDPMRTAMSFIQTSKHQVRTEDNDPPLVVNGAEEAMPYMTTDRFAFKAKEDGKVIGYQEDDYILIQYKSGKKDYINLKEEIEKNSDGGYYVPLKLDAIQNMKSGKTFKANEILAYDTKSFSNTVGESKNIAYNAGKLSKIAIINTDEGFEDSAVITEALARSLATRVNLKFDVIIDKNTNIISMLKVGDEVEAGHPLMVWQNAFEEEEANDLMKILAADKSEISELGKRVLDSEVTGKVTDIKIYRTVDISELSSSLKKIVNSYEAPYREREKLLKDNGINVSKLRAHDKLDTIGKLKKAEDSVLIEYYVEYLDTVGVGDKVVYYSANKGVEKNVIPLGKEPYTEFRPNEKIDAFVSQVSIDKRIVTSTLLYGSLQKLMVELDRSCKDILGIPYDDTRP